MRLQLSLAVFVAASAVAATAAAQDDPRWKLSSDTLVYSDTDNVVVVSPQVAVHRAIDEDGGSVGARVVVDVVSAASVDVVSNATTRFSEVRTEAVFSLAKAFGKHLPSLSYRYSHEPDYVSHGVGVGYQRELGSSDTVLRLGYNLSLDTVGYTGSPSGAFSEQLTSHGLSVSLTQVLSPTTLVRGVYTLSVQDGYMEKPYRYVPLFDQAGIDAAMADGNTIDLDTFDQYRLAMRPPEEVPDRRIGHAVAARVQRYVGWLPGALRLDYQLFADSWGVLAHTIQPSVRYKRSESQMVAVYGRVYWQQAADFWRREYVVSAGQLPRYRTLDRDLSSDYTVLGGARFEWTGERISAYVDASAMNTVYDDYIFLRSRFALVGQAGARLRW